MNSSHGIQHFGSKIFEQYFDYNSDSTIEMKNHIYLPCQSNFFSIINRTYPPWS